MESHVFASQRLVCFVRGARPQGRCRCERRGRGFGPGFVRIPVSCWIRAP